MLTVRDIMTRSVVVIRSSATVEDAIWLMRAKQVRSLIVEKSFEEAPYGIITEKDIVYGVTALGKDPGMVFVGSLMRRPCIEIPSYISTQEAAQLLSEKGIHRAPVVENNKLLGILSVTDILIKGALDTPEQDQLSLAIRAALQQARIVDNQEEQIRQECNLAWQVYEEIRQKASV
ncbi:MAG: CBS domain-containing protein [Cyanobacteria bacterium J06597_16]